MASFEPQNDPFGEPPPRPTTPPVRRGFLMVLAVLLLLTILVYGIPHIAERTGYAWEAGRSRAAAEALERLDEAGVIEKSSALFRMATAKVAPAVVNIRSLRTVQLPMGRQRMAHPGLIPVQSGSGFVIDKERGYVVTNNHVVENAEELVVRFGKGMELTAQVVGTDPKTDLAVLKVTGPLEVESQWGDSDKLDIGDWVLAIGSPLQLDRTVTAGIVSATGRSLAGQILGEEGYEDFIQTDAALNPGNSGGPLIDLHGRVVGVNTAIVSDSGGDQGLGLAISAKLAKRVVDDLIEHGRVFRGYLGVAMRDLDAQLAENLGLEKPVGALVEDVEPTSPADRAGLKPQDVIVRIGQKSVSDPSELRVRIAELPAGTRVPIEVVRDKEPKTIQATIGEMPVLLAQGLRLTEAPPELAQRLPGSPRRL